MTCLTLQLQQLEAIKKSKLTEEEKERLTKMTNGEIPWTKELDELLDKALSIQDATE